MPARPTQVKVALSGGRHNGVKMARPKKSAKSFTRERFGMDPTISTSVTQQNVARAGASKSTQALAVSSDENKRQANMAGKMRQQMLNTRKTNQFRAEQRRARMRGAGRAGVGIASGLALAKAIGDASAMDQAQINKAKSQTRLQGAPSPAIPGNREQIVGARQGRMFNERGQATAAQSKMPPKANAMKAAPSKSSTAKASANRAPITQALKIK